MARLKALAVIMLPLALVGCWGQEPPRVYHYAFPPENVVVHDNGEITLNYCFSTPISGKFSTRLHYEDSKGQIQIIHAREWSYMHAVRKWVGDGNEVVCDDFGATFAPSDLGKVGAVHVDYETTGGR